MTKGYLKSMTAAAVVALVVAACGDSGSSIDALDEAVTSTTSGGLFGGGGDSGGNDDQPLVTVGDIRGVSDECEALVNVFLSMSTVFITGEVSDFSPDALGGLPGDLQDDVGTVLEAMNAYGRALEDLGIDLSDPQALAGLTAEAAAELGALAESLDTDEFNSAIANLEAYGDQECEGFAPTG